MLTYTMKKSILKVFGVVALAVGMLYNVQVSDVENGSDVSLATLGNVAVANSEGSFGGICCQTSFALCFHPNGMSFVDAVWTPNRQYCP